MLAALSACSKPDAGVTIEGRGSGIPDYFAASAAGAFLVVGGEAFTVAERGAKAQKAACCDPTSEPIRSDGRSLSVRHGSVALDGTPWVLLNDGSAIDLKGREHVTAGAVRKLEESFDLRTPAAAGKPATTRGVSRHVREGAVSVVDSNAVLAATYTNPGSTYWHANDSVVYRVSSSGTPVAVAGRPGFGTARPVSSLKAGEHVAATEVDLERVRALVSLDQGSFVLFMTVPFTVKGAARPRLQAAVVNNGQISRLKLPDLCSLDHRVSANRISDHEVLLSALKGSAECRTPGIDRLRIDTAKNNFTKVGTGDGLVAIAGDQLLTATTKEDPRSLTTIRWQDLPDHP